MLQRKGVGKLIFKEKQENEEVSKKKADMKYQIDPEDSMASIPDLFITVLYGLLSCFLPLDAWEVAGP